MASLRNIMNVDDDHPDSGSLKRDDDAHPAHPQPPQLDSSSHISAYHPDLPTTLPPTHLHRAASSSHALPSLTPEMYPSSASPGFSSSGSTSRRRSNTSTDSMDAPYGYTHMGSSVAGPARPGASRVSGADVPLKLTPVTRKVSRARKGVPVHVCEQCRPHKVCAQPLTRAINLAINHLIGLVPSQDVTRCSIGRTFWSATNNGIRHSEQEDKGSRTTNSPRSSDYSHPAPTGAYPYVGQDRPLPPLAQPDSDIDISTNEWLGSSSGTRMSQGGGFPTPGADNGYPMPDFNTLPSSLGPAFTPRITPDPRLDLLTRVPSQLSIPEDNLGMAWHDGLRLPSSASSTYSTPSDEPARVAGTDWRAQASPYPSVPRDMHSPIMDPATYPIPMSYSTSPDPVYYPEAMGLPMAGLSPQLAEVQISETLVPAPAPLPTDRLIMPRVCGRQLGDARDLLAAKLLMPASLSSTLRDAIPAYLEVYWSKVHPVYPIIHKATIKNSTEIALEHDDVLQCAMASVATQFCDGKDDRIKGDQLHAFAWQKSKVFTQPDDWPLQIMQTVLLCEYYARFRGRKKTSHQPSSQFKLLFRKVFQEQRLDVFYPQARSALEQWKSWSRTEALHRLAAACFVLDVHTMCYYEQPSCAPASELDYSSPATISVPLSGSTMQLWDAEDLQLWQNLITSHRGTVTVSDAFSQGLKPSDIALLPTFDASVLLAAYALQLPRLRTPGAVDLKREVLTSSAEDLPLAALFTNSPSANTYIALHYTPLHALLSVSGDSWVFNKKVLEESSFVHDQLQLAKWRNSDDCRKAVIFATRALKLFLGLSPTTDDKLGGLTTGQTRTLAWGDISDYWAFYVCTLICWAYGQHDGSAAKASNATIQWIRKTADLQPARQDQVMDREAACGVVSLARGLLARENLGGRNILLADAVGVLTKLQDGGVHAFKTT
ncbi:hypothetical protein HJFPF1_01873 [Paramyrothecium foliicola]|nr:hypothetical protein HJFPF1_01873 [Paramyrothecium foliicola]